MESVFGWLGDIFRSILRIFPQLIIVRKTHNLVKFICGKNVQIKPPGIYFWWPLITEIELVPVVRQTTHLHRQYLTTKDDRCIGVSSILIYEVENTEKLFTLTWDYEDTICDYGTKAVKKIVCGHTLQELLSMGMAVDTKLCEELSPDLKHYGIKTMVFTLVDLAAWPAFIIDKFAYNGNGNGKEKVTTEYEWMNDL